MIRLPNPFSDHLDNAEQRHKLSRLRLIVVVAVLVLAVPCAGCTIAAAFVGGELRMPIGTDPR